MFHLLNYVSTPVFVLETDASGVPRYSYVNEALTQMHGIFADAIIGKTVLEAETDTPAQTAYQAQTRCFETSLTATYWSEIGADGNRRSVRTILAPETDAAGTTLRVIGTCIDVDVAQDAVMQNRSIKDHDEQLEQFLTLAAHDLRTPMRNVKTLTELLRDDFEDRGDGKLELIDMLDDVASKSNKLITEILDHSSTAHAPMSQTHFRLGALCDDIRSVLDPLSAHVYEWNDCTVTADHKVVHLLLRNLIDNSIKHGGTERMQIRINAVSEGGGMLRFEVVDTGKGIENPDAAFAGSGTFSRSGGYGLLGIKRLISARNGTISAQSRPDGTGTAVSFTLPGTLSQTAPDFDLSRGSRIA